MRKNIKPVLDQIKKEVIIETNRIRTNPKAYIPILERYLENFDDNVLTRPDRNECIETQEGPKAFKEAIEFLKIQKPINEIEFDEEASKVADEYAKILSNSGEDEQGQDESHIEARVEKYLDYDYAISENIDFGGSTGIEVIVNLLVDDGVKLRTHRDNLFSNKFQYYGVAVASHPEYDFCTVIDYFGDILSYKDKEKDKIFQEKKSKKKAKSSKINFPLTKKGLPNLSNKKSPLYNTILLRQLKILIIFSLLMHSKNWYCCLNNSISFPNFLISISFIASLYSFFDMDKQTVFSTDLTVAFLVVFLIRAISPKEKPSPNSPFLSSFSIQKLNLLFIKLVLLSTLVISILSKL